MKARRGGKARREHPRTADGDVATPRTTVHSEGLLGDAMRDTGQPVRKPDGAPRRGGNGHSNATAQDLSNGGNTTKTVPAQHSVSPFQG